MKRFSSPKQRPTILTLRCRPTSCPLSASPSDSETRFFTGGDSLFSAKNLFGSMSTRRRTSPSETESDPLRRNQGEDDSAQPRLLRSSQESRPKSASLWSAVAQLPHLEMAHSQWRVAPRQAQETFDDYILPMGSRSAHLLDNPRVVCKVYTRNHAVPRTSIRGTGGRERRLPPGRPRPLPECCSASLGAACMCRLMMKSTHAGGCRQGVWVLEGRGYLRR